MKFKVFQGRDNLFYFTVDSWLKAQHGPYKTRKEAKAAAEDYSKEF